MFEGLQDQIRATDDRSGSFLYWSIPYYWLRERHLAKKSVSWIPTNAVVNLAHRTNGGYGGTMRAELRYSYSFGGETYEGRVIRDTGFRPSSAHRLVDNHEVGQRIEVLVNPDKPGESYFSSGFGWIEPFLTLFLSALCTLLIAFIIVAVLIIPALQRLGF